MPVKVNVSLGTKAFCAHSLSNIQHSLQGVFVANGSLCRGFAGFRDSLTFWVYRTLSASHLFYERQQN